MRTTKIMAAVLALALIPFFSARALEACESLVDTAEGPVMGYSEKDLGVCAYKGIPFAQPPVEDLRWKPPLPPMPRDGVLEALEFGNRCMADGSGSGAPKSRLPEAGEDCLYLNVWRPAKSGTFPVMFWIHGGSLQVGTAAEPIYYGQHLAAAQDVVVVSINYRLNYYGYLAHPGLTEEDPNGSSGNYGLLDQVRALEWVRDNIGNFGGDPANVTIFGESAGGWSVCTLLATPLSEGLFHRAIMQSGGCDTVKGLSSGEEDGLKFAQSVGCTGEDAVSCMRAMSPEEMELARKAYSKAKKKEEKKDKDEGMDLESMMDFTFIPHLDLWALSSYPIDAIRLGYHHKVPFMVGSNRDEFKLFAVAVPGVRLWPPCVFDKLYGGVFGDEILEKTHELYPYKNYRRPADAIFHALGDMALGCKGYDAALAASKYNDAYYYRFDYDKHIAPHIVGAAHGVEIPFVFGTFDQPPANWLLTRCQTKKARELSETVMSYWANFARTGNPNGPGVPEWPAYTGEGRKRMVLDLPLQVETGDNIDRCEFWSEQNIILGDE